MLYWARGGVEGSAVLGHEEGLRGSAVLGHEEGLRGMRRG